MRIEVTELKREVKYLDDIRKGKGFTPIDAERNAVRKNRKKLKVLINKFFEANKPALIKELSKLMEPVEKASKSTKKKIDAIVDSLSWDDLVPDASVILGAMTTNGAAQAIAQIKADAKAAEAGPATRWAEDRAAELVGKKWVDGELVDNPNAEWAITDSTREMIQAMTADAIDSGMTADEFASAMEDSFAFSPERSEMIARTEMAMADSAGQVEGWAATGEVEGTEWTTAEDDAVSDECQMNAAAGVVPLGEAYPSGDEAPPAHPNCRCALIPVLIGE